jgi:hypothetical protein
VVTGKKFEGQNMVEYHVDSSSIFQEKADKETRFRGFSVFGSKMISLLLFLAMTNPSLIFKQYHMTKLV